VVAPRREIHTWGTGLPSNLSHWQIRSFMPAEAIDLMDEDGVVPQVIHPPGWDRVPRRWRSSRRGTIRGRLRSWGRCRWIGCQSGAGQFEAGRTGSILYSFTRSKSFSVRLSDLLVGWSAAEGAERSSQTRGCRAVTTQEVRVGGYLAFHLSSAPTPVSGRRQPAEISDHPGSAKPGAAQVDYAHCSLSPRHPRDC
jgi:hypothetical protein